MPELLKVSQFFARASELLGTEIELEGYLVVHRDNPKIIYLVEGVQPEGEIFNKKVQLSTQELFEESSKRRSFEEYWDGLVRDGKTEVSTELAQSHYHEVLREKSYQSLEFFIKTKTMDFYDEFAGEFDRTGNEYQKLERLSLYTKREQLDGYNIFTDKIIITGLLTEIPYSESNARFLNWASAKLYMKDAIVYLGKTLHDIPMRIENVTKLADIQDSSGDDLGYLRLEAILGGHYDREAQRQVLYLLPYMLSIHVDKRTERGMQIRSKEFYQDVLPACPPMRAPITHANPIHLTGHVRKLISSPYSHEISDIQEVAVLNSVGIWHLPIGVWRFDF